MQLISHFSASCGGKVLTFFGLMPPPIGLKVIRTVQIECRSSTYGAMCAIPAHLVPSCLSYRFCFVTTPARTKNTKNKGMYRPLSRHHPLSQNCESTMQQNVQRLTQRNPVSCIPCFESWIFVTIGIAIAK